MSDVKFRATVKHDGAEVGDLPWLEEFWAVRYGDYAALQARIEELEAERDREKAYADLAAINLDRAIAARRDALEAAAWKARNKCDRKGEYALGQSCYDAIRALADLKEEKTND